MREAALLDPAMPEINLNMALALRQLGRLPESLAALDALLSRDPGHFVALLSKGAVVEQLSGPRHAAKTYRELLPRAPDETRLPPPLRAALRHARDVVEADSAALQAHLRAGTAAFRSPDADLARFDESLDILAGAAPIHTQHPLLMYYARLPAIPFHDRSQFPFLAELEASTPRIVAELTGLLADSPDDFGPYVRHPVGAPLKQWKELNQSRRWSSYFLWENGIRNDEACRRCPFTAALVDRLPLMRQPGFAPTAVFSALEPHTHIPPHTGSVTTRLLIHLPLILPGPARFRVGNETRAWRMGEAWVFDDTIEHEAWNDADEMRVILILDVWNPLIPEAERGMIAALMDARKSYYA